MTPRSLEEVVYGRRLFWNTPRVILTALFFLFLGTPASQSQEIVLKNNSIITNIFGRKGEGRVYRIDLPANTKQLQIKTTSGTGDADIYLRWGAIPNGPTYDARSATPGNEENILINSPAGGSWFILLHAFENYNGLTFSALYSGSTYNAQISEIAWAFDVGNKIYSAPSIGADGTIYAAGTSSQHVPSLYFINPDGTLRDVVRFPWELYTSPVLARDGTIYLTAEATTNSNAGLLVAMSPAKSLLWEFPRAVQSRLAAGGCS